MELRWTVAALRDLQRLHGFLAIKNLSAADRAMVSIAHGVERVLDAPRIGRRLERFVQREVRRSIVAGYEVQYEIGRDYIEILRIFHNREDR